jgi:hypothetical protein
MWPKAKENGEISLVAPVGVPGIMAVVGVTNSGFRRREERRNSLRSFRTHLGNS